MFGKDSKPHLHLRDLLPKVSGQFPHLGRQIDRLNAGLGHLCLKGDDGEFQRILRQTYSLAKVGVEYRRPSGKVNWADADQVMTALLGVADDIAGDDNLDRRSQAMLYVLITFAALMNGAATPGESFMDFRLKDLSYTLPRRAFEAKDDTAFEEVIQQLLVGDAECYKHRGKQLFKWFPRVRSDAIYLAGSDGLKLPAESDVTLEFCIHMRRELIAAAETMGDYFLAPELVATLKQRVTDRLSKRDERRAAFAAALTAAFKVAGLPDGVPVEITYDPTFDAIDLSGATVVKPHIVANPLEAGGIGMFIRTADRPEDLLGDLLGDLLEVELVGLHRPSKPARN